MHKMIVYLYKSKGSPRECNEIYKSFHGNRMKYKEVLQDNAIKLIGTDKGVLKYKNGDEHMIIIREDTTAHSQLYAHTVIFSEWMKRSFSACPKVLALAWDGWTHVAQLQEC